MRLKHVFGVLLPLWALVIFGCGGGGGSSVQIIPVDPNKPASITLVANPTTGVINNNGPVTLTATVLPAGAGGAIANGTPVTFTILTGNGTLSGGGQTAIATTINGGASVTLNSSAVGTVTINAQVGSAPQVTSFPDTSVNFIAPTKAIVKLATSGTLPAGGVIDAIQLVLNYSITKGLSIVDAGAVVSGVANANLVVKNTVTPGLVNIAIANLPVGKIIPPIATQTGEFITLTFDIATSNPPVFPVVGDFTIITGAGNTSIQTTPATTLTASILSVTLR
ncbi:MAG: hypothetical protein HXX11_13370 [Desulfuromonadales bacterium]|nr:hypothetical protein [Desulfuromonadales bacterium]